MAESSRVVLLLLPVLLAMPGAARAQQAEQAVLKPGDPSVDGTFIRPFTSKLKISQTDAKGESKPWGTGTYQVEVVDENGRAALKRTQVFETPKRTIHTIGAADRKTFAPIWSEERDTTGYEVHLKFADDQVQIRRSTDPPGGELKQSTLKLDMPAFDFCVGLFELHFAASPLREGYSAKFPSYECDPDRTGWGAFRVTGREQVKVGDKQIEAWVVESQLSPTWREVSWLAKEPPYLLKWIFYGPKGGHETIEVESFTVKQ